MKFSSNTTNRQIENTIYINCPSLFSMGLVSRVDYFVWAFGEYLEMGSILISFFFRNIYDWMLPMLWLWTCKESCFQIDMKVNQTLLMCNSYCTYGFIWYNLNIFLSQVRVVLLCFPFFWQCLETTHIFP